MTRRRSPIRALVAIALVVAVVSLLRAAGVPVLMALACVVGAAGMIWAAARFGGDYPYPPSGPRV